MLYSLLFKANEYSSTTNNLGIKNIKLFKIFCFLIFLYSLGNINFARVGTSMLGTIQSEKSFVELIINKFILGILPLILFLSTMLKSSRKYFYIGIVLISTFLLNGIGQKGPIIITVILALVLSNFRFKILSKRSIVLGFFLVLFFVVNATIRMINTQGKENFSGYFQRVDGVEFIIKNPDNLIPLYTFNDSSYILMSLVQFLRFYSQEYQELIRETINGPKSLYLYNLGFSELDANFSFLSEAILMFGYVYGYLIAIISLIFLHRSVFKLLHSRNKIYYSLGIAILFNVIMIERGLSDYFTTFIKTFLPIYIVTKIFIKNETSNISGRLRNKNI